MERKETEGDRDDRFLRFAKKKGVQQQKSTPKYSAGRGLGKAWGGGLRRMVAAEFGPSRQDEIKYVTVPGRYVPVGFGKYVSPVVDPSMFFYYRLAAWRVAVPRTVAGIALKELLYKIYYYGPQSAGYVRFGDTLVPAILGPGDRKTVAESGIGYGVYPLTP